MTQYRSKMELLENIRVERRQLEKHLGALTKREITQRGVVGEWSVKDVLAHLVAWERLFLSWYTAGVRGSIPETTPVAMSRKAIDALNQRIFAQHRQDSLRKILTEFHGSYRCVWTTIQAIPEEDMFDQGRYAWTGQLTLADYIAGNTCNHYRWAKTQIRKWLKSQKRL